MRLIALLVLALAATAAQAQPYVSLALSPIIKVETGTSTGDDGNAVFVGAGYSFGRFAVEAGYLSESTSITGASTPQTTTSHTSQTNGFSLAAIATMPVAGRLSLLGKAGANYLSHKRRTQTVEFSTTPPVRVLSVDADTTSERNLSPSLGLGIEMALDEAIRVRALHEQIFGRGELQGIRLFSIQALYLF